MLWDPRVTRIALVNTWTESRCAFFGVMLAVHRTGTNVVVRAVGFNFQPFPNECLELA